LQHKTTQNTNPEQNQQDYNKKRGLSSPYGIGCHNHPTEKYCHSKDAVSNRKRNETERLRNDANKGFTEMVEH
jgi:hypothetical protein